MASFLKGAGPLFASNGKFFTRNRPIVCLQWQVFLQGTGPLFASNGKFFYKEQAHCLPPMASFLQGAGPLFASNGTFFTRSRPIVCIQPQLFPQLTDYEATSTTIFKKCHLITSADEGILHPEVELRAPSPYYHIITIITALIEVTYSAQNQPFCNHRSVYWKQEVVCCYCDKPIHHSTQWWLFLLLLVHLQQQVLLMLQWSFLCVFYQTSLNVLAEQLLSLTNDDLRKHAM